MQIVLTLKSDLCAASGHGYAATIDTDIMYDKNTGLPYVPAKRLRGRLREAGLEILHVYAQEPDGETLAETFFELFGERGASDSGKLNISSGFLPYIYNRGEPQISKYDVLDALTTIRSNTRMETVDKNTQALIKKAKDQSLRSARVLNKGNGEKITFHITKPLDKSCFEFLEKCCKLLRHIGSNRTRGWGEVECELIGEPIDKSSDTPPLLTGAVTDNTPDTGNEVTTSDEMRQAYKIVPEEPIISSLLSGGVGCEGYIPGSMLMGYFAKLWIDKYVADKEQAHKDTDFMRIFLKGEVKFGFAYRGDKEPFYPAPAGIKTNKTKDVFFNEVYAGYKPNPETSSRLGGYVKIIEEENSEKYVQEVGVDFESNMHHARPYNRAIGSPQKDKTVESGTFFSYTAISAWQNFFGSIVGKEEDLTKLSELIKHKSHIHLGRSRSAEYGNASFKWDKWDKRDKKLESLIINEGESICVTARSPLILCDDKYGTVAPCASLLAKKLSKIFDAEFTADRKFLSETIVAGFNSTWRLPRPQMPAISGGSVVVLKCETQVEITEDKREQFIGLRTGEGFGHIFIEKLPEYGELTCDNPPSSTMSVPSERTSQELKDKISQIKSKRAWEQTGIELGKALSNNDSNNLPSSAQLGRLISVLQGKYEKVESREKLRNIIETGWKDNAKRERVRKLCDQVFKQKPEDYELCDAKDESHVSKNCDFCKDDEKYYLYCLETVIRQIRLERRKNDGD